MTYEVISVPGDGIGPELLAAASEVLDSAGLDIEWHTYHAGYGEYQRSGHTAPDATLEAIRRVGVSLKGPFFTPSGGGPRSANHYIRHGLKLYACLRPIKDPSGTIDLLLVRENIEDHYPAIEWSTCGVAHAVKIASEVGCLRISEFALDIARSYRRQRVTLVHKANNLKLTEGLLLESARRVMSSDPEIDFDDMIADTACSTMILEPNRFEVVLANNTLGDLLSNIGAALAGSLGLVGSGNYGSDTAVFEGSHGSSDALTGTGRANPIAIVRAAALMVRHLDEPDAADLIEDAVGEVVALGLGTPDLGGRSSTAECTAEIVAAIQKNRTGE